MKSHTQKLLRKLSSLLLTFAMLATMLPALTLTANAQAVTPIRAATFMHAGARLAVLFREPVCGNPDCTAGLSLSNFKYTSAAGGFTAIASVKASPAGADWALLTMTGAADSALDILDKISIVDVYTASGMALSQGTGVSTTDAATKLLSVDSSAPTISAKKKKEGEKGLQIQFSEPVVDEGGNTLAVGDFAYANDEVSAPTNFASANPSHDYRWVTFVLDAVLDAGNHAEASDDGISITDNQLFDLVGNEIAAPTTKLDLFAFVADAAIPAFSAAYGRKGDVAAGGNDTVIITFSEPVFAAYAANAPSGDLATTDLDYADAAVITLTQHSAGDDVAIVDVGNNISGAAFGTLDSEGNAAIYDAFGNVMLENAAEITVTDNTFPWVRGVWVNTYIDHAGPKDAADDDITAVGGGTTSIAVVTAEGTVKYPTEGSSMYKWTDGTIASGDAAMINLGVDIHDAVSNLAEFTSVTFSIYYEDSSGGGADSVALAGTDDLEFVVNDAADLTTPSKWLMTTAVTEKQWTDITVDLTGAVVSGATALDDQVANPRFYGIKVVSGTTSVADGDVLYIDNVRFKRGATSKSNSVVIEYSESVDIAGDAADGVSSQSSSSIGNMTTSKTLAGLGAFASGTFSSETGKNTVIKASNGSSYTITFADRAGGLVTQASPTTLRGIFTPIAGITDNSTNALSLRSFSSGAIGSRFVATFDTASSATAPSNFSISVPGTNQMSASWTVPSSQSGFSHFAVLYKTTGSGATVADNNWDDSDQAALATSTTSSALVTGLVQGTTYYMKVAAVDRKGLATFNSSNLERSEVSSGPTSSDTTGPKAPTSLAASENANSEVVLTWVDPTDTDLDKLQVLKSIGKDSTDFAVLLDIAKGRKTYTDAAVLDGKTYNYQVRGMDNNGNPGTASSTVSVTIGATPASTADSSTADSSTADSSTADSSTVDSASTVGSSATVDSAEEEVAVPITIETKTGEKVTLKDAGNLSYGTKEVEGMVAKGIVKGDSKGYFNAKSSLNRAEAAAMIHRILKMGDPKAPTTNPFTDVSKSEWYAGYVADLKAKGLVKGKTSTTYAPSESMNRAEFLTIGMNAYTYLSKEAAITNKKGSATFSDVAAGAWYDAIIGAAVELKFVDAKKSTFNPASTINRLDATIILFNMFDALID